MMRSQPSLFELYPQLCEQWESIKNRPLSPTEVTPGSGKRVWWKCDKGHEWRAAIKNRANGAGCPYCSGRYATADNNFVSKYPNLAKEWHPNRNEGLSPTDITPGSHKKVWWICANGHEWQCTVKNRVYGRGCPYCASKFATSEDNLKSRFPEVTAQWHAEKNVGLSPTNFRVQSNKRVWWRCARGHEWLARIQDRTRGNSCSLCAPQTSQLEIRIYCELKAIFPNAIWRKKFDGLEIDVYIPELDVGVEIDGHYWHASREKFDVEKQKLLAIKGINVIHVRENPLGMIGENDLFYDERTPRKAIVDTILKAIESLAHSDYRAAFEQYMQAESFINPEEFSRIVSSLPGPPHETSLESTHPDLTAEWSLERNEPMLPTHFTAQSNEKVWWECPNGHHWHATIYTRTRGSGCPYCSGRLATPDKNLAAARPDLAIEWHPTKNGAITPSDLPPFSHRAIWWVCRHGHEWEAKVSNRANGGGCPFCSGRKVSKEKSLSVRFPQFLNEWHPSKNGSCKPDDVTPGVAKKIWWICAKGHEWEAAVFSRVRGSGCPYCAGKLPTVSDNFATAFPHLAEEWHSQKNVTLSPSHLRPRSNKKVWWLCAKAHEWEATLNNRASGQGCPCCSGRRHAQD